MFYIILLYQFRGDMFFLSSNLSTTKHMHHPLI